MLDIVDEAGLRLKEVQDDSEMSYTSIDVFDGASNNMEMYMDYWDSQSHWKPIVRY